MNTSEALSPIQHLALEKPVQAGMLLVPSGMPEFVQDGYSEVSRTYREYACGRMHDVIRQVRCFNGRVADSAWEEPEVCEICGAPMHRNGTTPVILRGVPFGQDYAVLAVRRIRCRCSRCGHCHDQPIPFKSRGHFMTMKAERYVRTLLEFGLTIRDVAVITGVNRNAVRSIDKERLQELYVVIGKDGKPVLRKPDRQARIIGIDEFKLHDGRQYATVIIEMETGVILWLAKGKGKDVVDRFIDHVGLEWMSKVEAVSSDMNAGFIAAFKERCPHIEAVYDRFHIVKNFNDIVVNPVRIGLIRELVAKGDKEGASDLKRGKYLLMAGRGHLQELDQAAGTPIGSESELFNIRPSRRKGGLEERYDSLLQRNHKLFMIDLVKDALETAYKAQTREEMRSRMESIILHCRATSDPHFIKYARLLRNHLEGIVSFADFHVTNGKVEGINRKIKTIRRRSYGLPDDEYFFLKLIDMSNMGIRLDRSHKI